MVQVLPYAPSPLERIGAQITQGFGDIAGNIEQKRARTALDKILNSQKQQQPDMKDSPQNMANAPEPSPQQTAAKNALQNVDLMNLVEKSYKNPKAGKAFVDSLIAQQTIQGKRENEIAKEQRSSFEAINKKREGERERIRSSRSSLTRGLQAVQSGNVGGFDINYLASLLGPAGEPLKTASGAQLDSTMKNLLIDSISEVTGRPNQWIEQQVKGATPSVGKTQAANETIFSTYLTDLDIEERKLDIEDKLMQDFTSTGRPIPSNFENLVSKELKPYAELQEDKLAYKLREIQEKEKGPRFLKSYEKVPQGTPLTRERGMAFLKTASGDKQRAATLAKKAGYTIYSEEIMQEIGR